MVNMKGDPNTMELPFSILALSPSFLDKLTQIDILPKSHRKEVMPHDNSEITK